LTIYGIDLQTRMVETGLGDFPLSEDEAAGVVLLAVQAMDRALSSQLQAQMAAFKVPEFQQRVQAQVETLRSGAEPAPEVAARPVAVRGHRRRKPVGTAEGADHDGGTDAPDDDQLELPLAE
jgi:hypothetical protein